MSFVDSLYPLVITGDAVGARDLLLGLEGKELIEAHRSGPAPLPLGRGEPDHGALRGRTVCMRTPRPWTCLLYTSDAADE